MGENVEEMKIAAAAGDGGDLGDLEYSVNKLSTEVSEALITYAQLLSSIHLFVSSLGF